MMKRNRQLYERIMRNVSREIKRTLNESEELIDYNMLRDALYQFGTLDSDDIFEIFSDNLFDINGSQVLSIYVSGSKMYYTIKARSRSRVYTVDRELYLRDFTDKQLHDIYDYITSF